VVAAPPIILSPQFGSSKGRGAIIDLGSVRADFPFSLTIRNDSDDFGRAHPLTDLTIHSLMPSGDGAGLFSPLHPPVSVLHEGDARVLNYQASAGALGSHEAKLTVATDEQAPYQGTGNNFEFTIQFETLPPLTTYDGWMESYFDQGDLGNPLIVGPLADPDKDGLENRLEYAMGFNPNAPFTELERSALPALTGAPGPWSLSFRLPEVPGADVTFVVEARAALDSGAWQEIARRVTDGAWTGPATVSEGPPSGGRVPVSLLEINAPPDAKRSYRLGAIVATSAP